MPWILVVVGVTLLCWGWSRIASHRCRWDCRRIQARFKRVVRKAEAALKKSEGWERWQRMTRVDW